MPAFSLDALPGGIAVLTFDQPGSKVNTLGTGTLGELGERLADLGTRDDLRGLIVRSGKPGQCIAGADLREIAELADGPEGPLENFIELGQRVFGQLEQLPFPTVALIDGPALGGGLEMLLACDGRIGIGSATAKPLGLPEVKLGLIPAWGGTQRLPRLIDPREAVRLLTTGESITCERARLLGLLDHAAPESSWDEAVALANGLIARSDWLHPRRAARQGAVVTDADFLNVVNRRIDELARDPDPAASVVARVVRDGAALPLADALRVERAAALPLFRSAIARNRIAVFFLRQRIARAPAVADPDVRPKDVARAGVLGAGLMGSGIAGALGRAGLPVALVDSDPQRLAAGRERAGGSGQAAWISASTDPEILAGCDVVIEAVTEDESVKHEALRRVAGLVGTSAILATNTSTLAVSRLAEAVSDPSRFGGLHFFHPVERMELVEVVRGERTNPVTLATLASLARRVGKVPIVVGDGPGFLVNRVLFPYLMEAVELASEGVALDEIDGAATAFGLPMGPIALLDFIGLDTALGAATVLAGAFPNRMRVPPLLRALVAAGRLGQKAGTGFRAFPGNTRRGVSDPTLGPLLAAHRSEAPAWGGSATMMDRLILPMVLEARRALADGIAPDAGTVDLALILGIGFPAWRGGLLKWADELGERELRSRLDGLKVLGARFEPPG
jgi:3-hydroxyacyl-CoA dehydrogenase/enoyl-CoA hydratase/3-hydroxybutyryl-CoA epimerase/enoyl-CoA isomerase